MDPANSRYPESVRRESGLLPCGRERGKVSGTGPTDRGGRARDRKPHLLPSEPRALLARACASGIERDPVVAGNDYRPLDDALSAALRRRYQPVEDHGADAAPARAGPRLS